ncbi:hypothetical protein E2C01_069709 [Portunus trituberculatus]|uniref:Uncharacterized protein n=1 Tax=Portunus trituberculatus TaxID=210409 RepID=A0A5B7HZA4_PORTR|nr:hypothetical protein [Portunus trituberculatus]
MIPSPRPLGPVAAGWVRWGSEGSSLDLESFTLPLLTRLAHLHRMVPPSPPPSTATLPQTHPVFRKPYVTLFFLVAFPVRV